MLQEANYVGQLTSRDKKGLIEFIVGYDERMEVLKINKHLYRFYFWRKSFQE
jgi:hypothetical protein